MHTFKTGLFIIHTQGAFKISYNDIVNNKICTSYFVTFQQSLSERVLILMMVLDNDLLMFLWYVLFTQGNQKRKKSGTLHFMLQSIHFFLLQHMPIPLKCVVL